MKKFGKLVALLLVAVMSLSMLTACSGGAAPATQEEKAAEENAMAVVNNVYTASVASAGEGELDNNMQLKYDAKAHLEEALKKLSNYKVNFKVDVESGNGTAKVYFVGNADWVDTLLEASLKAANYAGDALKVNSSSKWTKVAVAAKTTTSGTYICVVIEVTNPTANAA